MKEGDVVLAALPQSDGQTKLRPVLLLRQLPPPYNDFLACGISTQIHQKIENFDELLTNEDDDFNNSGLLKESIIRLSFLTVVPSNILAGTIGKISESRNKKLLKRLSDYLIKEINNH